jgi:hypothetical protein
MERVGHKSKNKAGRISFDPIAEHIAQMTAESSSGATVVVSKTPNLGCRRPSKPTQLPNVTHREL